ncbi:MAG TPA: hypothetical protein VN748_12120 [Pseudonocardiaceae bacterium]|jgi:hypothetical protein|nr:hypothetical protein [Pseudonocardiaceae bacterium]
MIQKLRAHRWEHVLRQTLIALAAGHELDKDANPWGGHRARRLTVAMHR